MDVISIHVEISRVGTHDIAMNPTVSTSSDSKRVYIRIPAKEMQIA